MKHNHDLIVKYLQLIQEQEQIIDELSRSNKKLLNRSTELKNQKQLYKQSAKIYIIVTNTKMGLSKMIDATEFTVAEFEKTCRAYAVNFDVRVKRYI